MMTDVFAQRRSHTAAVVEKLVGRLKDELGDRHSTLIGEHTCVYATGSCGRMEMGDGSDLDAYIVRVDGGALSNSSEIEQAVEIANEAAGLPPLDGGGKYLEMVEATEILDMLGEPQDDGRGVLTKRMLLLLESRVLLGHRAHATLTNRVVDAYWKNEELHPHDYLPIVLVNDIIRYWRIVLLNHEWKLRKKGEDFAKDPRIDPKDEEDLLLAERRYRSYKLRFPRCLTCFSALTYLLALTPTEPAHVSRSDIQTMIGMTPVERLQRLPQMVDRKLDQVDALLSIYGEYLERTNAGKQKLVEILRSDPDAQRKISQQGREFTRHMFDLVQDLGGGRTLHRHMLV